MRFASCRSAAGATIHLMSGTYNVPTTGLDLSGMSLTIEGDGVTTTTVDYNSGVCLTASCKGVCAATTLTLKGFTIAKGLAKMDGGCLSVGAQTLVMR